MERTHQDENTLHGQERLTIGQMAQRSGINAKAIRYYESIGLLPKAPRSANGYRSFCLADLNRLILLRRLRLLGVSLDRLAPLLRETTDAQCADVQQEVLHLIAERLAVIDEEMKELGLLREQVQAYHQHLFACHPASREAFQDCRDLSCLALSGETLKEEVHDALSNAR
ncbi:MerR family DNA-binding transcriptional regulator [Ktedonobacter sp. SOSP1-52]|uniref:MerR family DNA-binding transcriptional regulator n=1 Tax=Ktedonobacter sp. SOSP1-52 TaxID=2778366 RepID=UPI001F45D7A8|nr:MerR family DNA-binding transcriptional regulator [Ktedonobacter sp. SOSP1-52]